MNQGCEICGDKGPHSLHLAREMMVGTRAGFQYLECATCGCLQNVSVPDDLASYYASDYYAMRGGMRPEPRWRRRLKAWRTAAHLGRRGWLGRWLLKRSGPPGLPPWVRMAGLHQQSRILEIGCGAGDQLRALQSEGFKQISGADPYIPQAIDHGDGLQIVKTELAALTGTWDCVVLEHAFEHIPSPHAALRKLVSLLRPGGVLIISVPLKAAAWELYGVNWVQLDAPRHLYLHTERSFRLLAAELEIVHIDFDSTAFQFWGSEQYAADIPLLDPRSYRQNPAASGFTPADIAAFELRAQALNAQGRGDQATFHLRLRPA